MAQLETPPPVEIPSATDRRGTPSPLVVGVLGAVAGGLALGLLSFSSILPGVVLIGMLIVCALAIPSAHHLAGRVLRMVPLLTAICFLTWMVPSPAMPHGDLVAAVIGATLGYHVARGARSGTLKRLLPQLDVVDLVAVPGVAAVQAINLKHMVAVTDPESAIAFWSLQWDNSSHSFIDVAMRHNGVLLRFLPLAPDGTKFSFTEYPAAYHATAEAFMTYLLGHRAADVSTELLAFVRVTGLLGVLGAVLAACAVASLIGVRRNQLTASIGAGLAASVMIAGPGALGLVDAHYNFPFTLALVMAAMSTVVSMPRVWNAWRFSLLIATVTCAAGSWLPLGVLAGVMALGIALPLERRRWSGTRAGIVTCLVVGVVGAAVSATQALWVLQAVPSSMLDAAGGITRVLAHQFTMALVFTLFGLAWTVWRGGRRGLRRGVRMRFAVVGVALLGFAGVYFVLAAQQLQEFGEVRYYPEKMQDGFVVLALVYAGMAIALIGAAWPMAERLGPVDRVTPARRRPVARATAALAGLVAMFTFGLPVASPLIGVDTPATPGSLRNQIKLRPELSAAVAAAGLVPADTYAIVAVSSKAGQALQDSVLTAALRGTYSNGTSALLVDMLNTKPKATVDMAPALVKDLTSGKAVIITTAALAPTFKAALPGVPAGSIKVI